MGKKVRAFSEKPVENEQAPRQRAAPEAPAVEGSWRGPGAEGG